MKNTELLPFNLAVPVAGLPLESRQDNASQGSDGLNHNVRPCKLNGTPEEQITNLQCSPSILDLSDNGTAAHPI